MSAVLGRSDFDFADLKQQTASVFLVLPPDRLSSYARWLRLLVTRSLEALVRAPGARGFDVPAAVAPARAPVLFLLDQFAALGYLTPLE